MNRWLLLLVACIGSGLLLTAWAWGGNKDSTGGAGPAAAGAQAALGLEVTALIGPNSAFNSDSPKSASVTCPTGKRPVGGGFHITSTGSAAVAAVTSGPNPMGVATPTGWTVLAREVEPTTLNWSVGAHVVCAKVTA